MDALARQDEFKLELQKERQEARARQDMQQEQQNLLLSKMLEQHEVLGKLTSLVEQQKSEIVTLKQYVGRSPTPTHTPDAKKTSSLKSVEISDQRHVIDFDSKLSGEGGGDDGCDSGDTIIRRTKSMLNRSLLDAEIAQFEVNQGENDLKVVHKRVIQIYTHYHFL